MNLDEFDFSALKNAGVSAENFQWRQEVFDSLNNGHSVRRQINEDLEVATTKLSDMFDAILNEWILNRIRSVMQQKVLPVTMVINGETKKVGEALIEARTEGFCIIHAIVDGEEDVAALLGTDLNQISIGNKNDFKKEI